jgi:hypothetical protein
VHAAIVTAADELGFQLLIDALGGGLPGRRDDDASADDSGYDRAHS